MILPTRWHERFFSSKVHNRIPSDVTFIDTRYDFSPSDGPSHRRGGWQGIPLACPLSHHYNYIFHASLPASSPSSFFIEARFRNPLSPQTSTASNMRTRTARQRTPIAPIKPVDFIGSSFQALLPGCEVAVKHVKKKGRKRSTGQSERATPVSRDDARRSAEKYAR